MTNHRNRALLSLSALMVVTSCGDGPGFSGLGDGVAPPAGGPPPPPPQQGTFITLTSDTDDYIGAGENYAYTLADALITITAQDGLLTVDIDGDEWWTGEFQLPDIYPSLEVGTYNNLTRYPFHDAAVGGLSWSGEGRGCNTLDGLMTIDSVTYNGTELTNIDLSFEQYCEAGTSALRGQVHFDASDATTPPGPVVPAPNDLWAPMEGVTPATGNYVYLTSQQGDFIGAGADYLYTDATAAITVDATDGNLSVTVTGAEGWNGEFQVMNFLTELEAGYYGDLQRYPFHNPVKGGLSWSGEGRGCNTLTGWFAVDSVTYDTGALTAVDLRFEQHCEGGTPALFGEIHWVM
jgi:hypothetical protein